MNQEKKMMKREIVEFILLISKYFLCILIAIFMFLDLSSIFINNYSDLIYLWLSVDLVYETIQWISKKKKKGE